MPGFKEPEMPIEDKKQKKVLAGRKEVDWDKLIKDHPVKQESEKLKDKDSEEKSEESGGSVIDMEPGWENGTPKEEQEDKSEKVVNG